MIAEVFASAVNRAREKTLTVMDLLSTVGQLSGAGQAALVPVLYKTWIDHNLDNPLLYAVYFNYSAVLSGAGDLEGARHALSEAIRINPEFIPPYINLGHILERLGMIGEGVNMWYAAVGKLQPITGESVSYKLAAYKQIGRVLERANFDVHAEDALRQSLDLNPDQPDVTQHWVSLRQRQCKWPVIQPWGNVTRVQLLNGISALSLAAHTDDPLMQLGNAYRYCKHNIGQPKTSFVASHPKPAAAPAAGRRKIGYLSSDLREHAIGFLTPEVYELHDRSKVEVSLYYCGHQVSDRVHTRIKASADRWVDINTMTDEAAAQKIVDDGIEILVDINGYTHAARTKMLAMRPAPVIVNWLGFPGSVGSPYHNYLIADEFIIPKGDELYYSEKVLRLPCYQPNDRKRLIADTRPARQDAGLPEDAVVYCCFNGLHKITPFTWRRWMSILQQVPNSVLWLLEGTIDSTHVRLREAAVAEGVSPDRIILARKKHNPDHLARYPLADLFLDTSPYGAHTTSSDAMWMGVPVLTLVGRSFAARVCGSLVKAAGLDELVCTTPEQYIATAVELGRNRDKLLKIREKLKANRDTCVLFDSPLLVSRLEDLYAQMWEEFRAGKLPRPDLSNLEIYNDIGVDLDQTDVDLLTVPNYRDLYRQKLAEHHSYSYLRGDCRLWPGEDRH